MLGQENKIVVNRESLEKLIQLFNLQGKRAIEKYCRDLVISSEELSSIILAGRVRGLRPYVYTCHFNETVPEHLPPSLEELNALGRNGVGPLQGKAKKAITKITQIFIDRKMLAAHLFYTPSQKYWHLFYFDQRDIRAEKNHWTRGPHIHYSHDSFVREPLQEVWNKVCLEKPQFPKSVHILYDYHHNRPPDAGFSNIGKISQEGDSFEREQRNR